MTSGIASEGPAATRPIRALLVAENDKWHDCTAVATHVAAWLRENLPRVEVSPVSGRDQLTPGGLAGYDLLLSLIGLGPEASEAEEQAVTQFVSRGGGLFGAHNSNIYAPERQGLYDLWGARFARHPKYQPFTVRIVDHDHPITRGLDDFTVSDELYILDRRPPSAHLLAVAVWEGETHPMAYTKRYGEGRVYYCALGHDAGAWDLPAYRALMVRGVAWLANQV